MIFKAVKLAVAIAIGWGVSHIVDQGVNSYIRWAVNSGNAYNVIGAIANMIDTNEAKFIIAIGVWIFAASATYKILDK
jgi:hypothetical protein